MRPGRGRPGRCGCWRVTRGEHGACAGEEKLEGASSLKRDGRGDTIDGGIKETQPARACVMKGPGVKDTALDVCMCRSVGQDGRVQAFERLDNIDAGER